MSYPFDSDNTPSPRPPEFQHHHSHHSMVQPPLRNVVTPPFPGAVVARSTLGPLPHPTHAPAPTEETRTHPSPLQRPGSLDTIQRTASPHHTPPPIQNSFQYPGQQRRGSDSIVHSRSTSLLSMPGPPARTIEEDVDIFLGSGTPLPPRPELVDRRSNGPRCLATLATMRAWLSVEASAKVFLGDCMLDTHRLVDVKLCRCLALLRLRRPEEARIELNEVTDICNSAAQQPPFAAKLMLAEIELAAGNWESAIDTITALKLSLDDYVNGVNSDLEKTISREEAVIWRRRLCTSLASAFQGLGKWRPALAQLRSLDEDLRDAMSTNTVGSVSKKQSALRTARCEVLSRMGRLFLQLGDVHQASALFTKASAEATGALGIGFQNAQHKGMEAQILMNAGLLAFAKSDYGAAATHFENAMKAASVTVASQVSAMERSSFTNVPYHACDPTDCSGVEEEGAASLLRAAVNNSAIAALYACDLPRALACLEGAVRRDPALYMRDTVVFNLCTLYDLSRDPAASTHCKKVLEALAQRYSLDDLNKASLRLQNP